MAKSDQEYAKIEKRSTHWSVYAIDRSAGFFIRIGGLLVIMAVVAIIVFIASEAFPLFQNAEATALDNHQDAPAQVFEDENEPILQLSDPTRRLSMTLDSSGEFIMTSLVNGATVDTFRPEVFGDKRVVSASFSSRPRRVTRISRNGWQTLGEHNFAYDEDLGEYRLDSISPQEDQQTISPDGKSVTHYLTHYFDAIYEHEDEEIDLSEKDFEYIKDGVPSYGVSVLLDDGSVHLIRASFYNTILSFDPRFTPKRFADLNHPEEEDFKQKSFLPDTMIMAERVLRGESKRSILNGSDLFDTDGRKIRYELLPSIGEGSPTQLLAAKEALETAYEEDLNAFPNWYQGKKCIVEKLAGYGQGRGRALLSFRATGIDIAHELEVLPATSAKPVALRSDLIPSDFAADRGQKKSSPSLSTAFATIEPNNTVFVTRQQLNVGSGAVDLDESSNTLRSQLSPKLFGADSDSFPAPIVDVLVTVLEAPGFAPARVEVLLEDGTVYPYLISTLGEDKESAENKVDKAAPTYNIFEADGDGKEWAATLDDGGAGSGQLTLTAASKILGGYTTVFGDSRGGLQAWFPVRDEEGNASYKRIRSYPPSGAGITHIAPSQKSKGFLVADSKGAIRGINMTTGRIFLEESAGQSLSTLHYGSDADAFFAWDEKHQLHSWSFDAPHADANLNGFFGKIHYENLSEPIWKWESSGNQESEAKLSLVPLVVGTLKGAFYAMLFSIPIAIAAAVYTSEFMSPKMRAFIKPIMEVMASVPSVVLGILAALVLGPFFEANVNAAVLLVIFVPVSFLVAGWLWQQLPPTVTGKFSPMVTFLMLFALLGVSSLAAFHFGPKVGPMLFPASESAAPGEVHPETFEALAEAPVKRIDRNGESQVRNESVGGEIVTPAERLDRGNVVAWPTGGAPIQNELKVELASGEELTYPKGWWIPSGSTGLVLLLLVPMMLLVSWLLRVVFSGARFFKRDLHIWRDQEARFHPSAIRNSVRSSIIGDNNTGLKPVLADSLIAAIRLLIVLALALGLSWLFAGIFGELFFTYKHPSAGEVVDFRRAIVGEDGWDFTPQVNAIVLAVAMGIAVIPIIYTISEDALATVPNQLRAASLGCGASPWQTATRVVLPAAMPGIFSAVVIGLGRAIGETMIVLMAAGAKPITDFDPLGGFYSLSAAIAYEIPEAAKDGTLYRTLFLAGVILFAMTFVLNTIAEIVRLRLRRKLSRV